MLFTLFFEYFLFFKRISESLCTLIVSNQFMMLVVQFSMSFAFAFPRQPVYYITTLPLCQYFFLSFFEVFRLQHTCPQNQVLQHLGCLFCTTNLRCFGLSDPDFRFNRCPRANFQQKLFKNFFSNHTHFFLCSTLISTRKRAVFIRFAPQKIARLEFSRWEIFYLPVS